MKDDITAIKKTRTKIRDLTNCATFHICARCGVHSLLYHDSYEKVTMVFCEEGEKAWPCCPTFTDTELQAWKYAQEEAGLIHQQSLESLSLCLFNICHTATNAISWCGFEGSRSRMIATILTWYQQMVSCNEPIWILRTNLGICRDATSAPIPVRTVLAGR